MRAGFGHVVRLRTPALACRSESGLILGAIFIAHLGSTLTFGCPRASGPEASQNEVAACVESRFATGFRMPGGPAQQ